jgi:dienelactone hydrolase
VQTYVDAALSAGVAAVIVDSYAPRRISRRMASLTICTGARFRGAERAGDLFAALHWLKHQPWADAGRCAAIGWSHGGWTLMDALALGTAVPRATGLPDAHAGQLAALKTVVLVYPYAAFPSLTSSRGWTGAAPAVRAVICGKDAVVGERYPRRAFERLARDGLDVDTLYFPDATHAFEDDKANDPRSRFMPDLADRSRAYFATALADALLPRRACSEPAGEVPEGGRGLPSQS